MQNNTMGIGAALLAALFWAIATRMFSKLGKTLNPAGLNSVKSILAVLLLLLTLAGRSLLTGQSWINLQTPEFIFLAVSGVLGIGIGDTAYFGASQIKDSWSKATVAEKNWY